MHEAQPPATRLEHSFYDGKDTTPPPLPAWQFLAL